MSPDRWLDELADAALPDAETAASTAPADVDFSAIGAVCGNDPRLMRDLRASLAVIARRTDDPSLRRLAVSVLRGSVSVRRVFEHSSFRQMATVSTDHLEEGLERLDDEQREQLLTHVGAGDTPQATEFALMEGRPVPAPVDGSADRG